jgi:uncharacterized SAM-binding protein YcdF (DUF218 family)
MFYAASKIYWMFASPVALLFFAALIGAIFSNGRHARLARAAAIGAILLLMVFALTPASLALIGVLEDRYPEPPADMAAPYGIIILGGAVNGGLSEARRQVVFDEGERAVEAAILAARYPDARVVYTGASGFLLSPDNFEAVAVRRLLTELGVADARITIEDRARNTDDNARFTAALVHPQPDQRWLLVTSAFHMPRSMGLFEKAGFNVVAYPVAFRTAGPGTSLWWEFDPARNLRTFEIAMKEYIGLAMYRATGRIDRLFPGP